MSIKSIIYKICDFESRRKELKIWKNVVREMNFSGKQKKYSGKKLTRIILNKVITDLDSKCQLDGMLTEFETIMYPDAEYYISDGFVRVDDANFDSYLIIIDELGKLFERIKDDDSQKTKFFDMVNVLDLHVDRFMENFIPFVVTMLKLEELKLLCNDIQFSEQNAILIMCKLVKFNNDDDSKQSDHKNKLEFIMEKSKIYQNNVLKYVKMYRQYNQFKVKYANEVFAFIFDNLDYNKKTNIEEFNRLRCCGVDDELHIKFFMYDEISSVWSLKAFFPEYQKSLTTSDIDNYFSVFVDDLMKQKLETAFGVNNNGSDNKEVETKISQVNELSDLLISMIHASVDQSLIDRCVLYTTLISFLDDRYSVVLESLVKLSNRDINSTTINHCLQYGDYSRIWKRSKKILFSGEQFARIFFECDTREYCSENKPHMFPLKYCVYANGNYFQKRFEKVSENVDRFLSMYKKSCLVTPISLKILAKCFEKYIIKKTKNEISPILSLLRNSDSKGETPTEIYNMINVKNMTAELNRKQLEKIVWKTIVNRFSNISVNTIQIKHPFPKLEVPDEDHIEYYLHCYDRCVKILTTFYGQFYKIMLSSSDFNKEPNTESLDKEPNTESKSINEIAIDIPEKITEMDSYNFYNYVKFLETLEETTVEKNLSESPRYLGEKLVPWFRCKCSKIKDDLSIRVVETKEKKETNDEFNTYFGPIKYLEKTVYKVDTQDSTDNIPELKCMIYDVDLNKIANHLIDLISISELILDSDNTETETDTDTNTNVDIEPDIEPEIETKTTHVQIDSKNESESDGDSKNELESDGDSEKEIKNNTDDTKNQKIRYYDFSKDNEMIDDPIPISLDGLDYMEIIELISRLVGSFYNPTFGQIRVINSLQNPLLKAITNIESNLGTDDDKKMFFLMLSKSKVFLKDLAFKYNMGALWLYLELMK